MSTQNIFDLTDTWNNVATTFTAVKMNVTDTASAAGSLLMDLQVGGATKANITKGGLLTLADGVKGTTTNDSAAAGTVGEFISATVLNASQVALTSNVAANVTSISLTAGDWDVEGIVWYAFGAGTTCSYLTAWISTTSATVPTAPGSGALNQIQAAVTGNSSLLTGKIRISLASTTTVYLSAQSGFAVAGMGVYGFIGARRVR
jgi:hypothetical protein